MDRGTGREENGHRPPTIFGLKVAPLQRERKLDYQGLL